MARFLFIVARQLPGVYEHLCQQFGAEPDVEVIIDRRKAPASGAEGHHVERRRNDRVDEQLRVMGYAFVRIAE